MQNRKKVQGNKVGEQAKVIEKVEKAKAVVAIWDKVKMVNEYIRFIDEDQDMLEIDKAKLHLMLIEKKRRLLEQINAI